MPQEEEKDLNYDKPVETKGESTVGGDAPDITPNEDVIKDTFKSEPLAKYKEVTTPGEYKLQQTLQRSAAPDPYKSTAPLTYGSGQFKDRTPYAVVDLSDGIPDYWERKQFKDVYGEKLVKLSSPDLFAISFEDDYESLARFKKHKYDTQLKRFIDDLDNNQGWMSEMYNTSAKLIGKTAVGATYLIPLIYGMGSALINKDANKIINNSLTDAWDWVDKGLDENLVVYGGSDVWDINPLTGEYTQKGFLARFANDPSKSLNQDVAPAVSFIASTVIQELALSAATAFSGGAAAPALIANTARLGTQLFSRGSKILRGIDTLEDATKAAQVMGMTQKYRAALGTAVAGVRSAGYESALIGRSTEERTYQKMIEDHRRIYGRGITMQEADAYRQKAKDAGQFAFYSNIPLVAGSNFVQFPRLFMRHWKMAKAGAQVSRASAPWKLQGTRYVNGKFVANVDSNKVFEYLGYGVRGTKGAITEGWEEFAQGAMEEGLIDHYSSYYGAAAAEEKVGLLNALTKAGKHYLDTTEGKDSVTIGALMGMLGIRIPGLKIDQKTGKVGFSILGTGFGGARQEINAFRNQMKQQRAVTDYLNNKNPEFSEEVDLAKGLGITKDEVLGANFENALRHIQLQKNMDSAAMVEHLSEFKNNEHASLYSLIRNRHKLGVADTVIQEIEALEKMSVEEFNKNYGTQDTLYDSESKREVLEKAKRRAQNTIEAISMVETSTKDQKVWVDRVQSIFNKEDFKNITQEAFATQVVDQMAYLYSVGLDSNERIEDLKKDIRKYSDNDISYSALEDMIVKVADINNKTLRAEFNDNLKEVTKELKESWRRQNPNNFHADKVLPLLQDISRLHKRKAEAAKLYDSLFSPRGIKTFTKFADKLEELHNEKLKELAEKLAEAEIKNAKNPQNIDDAVNNANSVFGTADIVKGPVEDGVVTGLEDARAIMSEVAYDQETYFNPVLQLLDKYPELFSEVRRIIKEEQGIAEFTTVAEMDQEERVLAVEAIKALLNNLDQIKKITYPHVNPGEPYVDPNNENIDAVVFEGIADTMFEEGIVATGNATLLQLFDKQFINKEARVGPDGKRIKDEKSNHPNDPAVTNAPEFLSNKQLEEEEHYAIFRINKSVERNEDGTFNAKPEDILIDAYHKDPQTGEETFIGQLPAYKLNTITNKMPHPQLLALRKLVVAKALKPKTEDKTPDLRKEKEEIINELRQIQNTRKNNTETVETLENKKKELESLKEGPKTIEETTQPQVEDYSGKEFTVAKLKEIAKEKGIAVPNKIKKADLITLLKEYDAAQKPKQEAAYSDPQLAAKLEEEITTLNEKAKTIVEDSELNSKEKDLKDRLSKLNKRIRKESELDLVIPSEESNESNYDAIKLALEELEDIDQDTTRGKILYNKKVKEITEKFGAEAVARIRTIEANFQAIVNQLEETATKKGWNIFFDESASKGNQFKNNECK